MLVVVVDCRYMYLPSLSLLFLPPFPLLSPSPSPSPSPLSSREAVEHFLTALEHQQQARGPTQEVGGVSQMSETVWSTLRLAITFLGRSDLIPKLEERNLDHLLNEFGLAH